MPQPKTYNLKIQEKENGYININYAGYYTFKVYGNDRIRLYKERNRVRIYGNKAWNARVYIYYKWYYLWRINIKITQSYKIITIKKKIYKWEWARISVRNWRRYNLLKYDYNKLRVYKRRRRNNLRVYAYGEGKAEVWLRSRYENVDYRIIFDIVKPKPLEVSPQPNKIKVWETKSYNLSYEKWVNVRLPRYTRRYLEAKIENGKLILKWKKENRYWVRVLLYDGLRRRKRYRVKVEKEDRIKVVPWWIYKAIKWKWQYYTIIQVEDLSKKIWIADKRKEQISWIKLWKKGGYLIKLDDIENECIIFYDKNNKRTVYYVWKEVKDEKEIWLSNELAISSFWWTLSNAAKYTWWMIWWWVVYLWRKVAEVSDKERLIYYGRRYIWWFGLTEKEKENFQEWLEDATLESLWYAVAAGIATEVVWRWLKKLADVFGKWLLKKYGKKIAAKFIGKFIPVVWWTLLVYSLYDLAKNDYEIHRRCNTDGGVFDWKPQAYWCWRLMVDGLLTIAWVWVVWYKWGKLVGKYRRVKVISDESRVQHAYRHLVDEFGNRNKENSQKFKDFIVNILSNYDKKIVKIELKWQEKFIRYIKKIDDTTYQIDVYKTWSYKWLLRTVTKVKVK